MKPIDELINKKDSAWPLIQKWLSKARNKVEVLPVNQQQADKVLCDLQVTTRSSLGTVAYHTGGILFDNGWLRFLGSGHNLLPRNLSTWNQFDTQRKARKLDGGLLIADDVVGGFFALNRGLFDGKIGDVFYLAPDTLEWEWLEMGYSEFLYWACTGKLEQFYETFRWNRWEEGVKKTNGNHGILIYPHKWTREAEAINRARSIVPIEELWDLNMMYREKFGCCSC